MHFEMPAPFDIDVVSADRMSALTASIPCHRPERRRHVLSMSTVAGSKAGADMEVHLD
jgi:hypothetical protein